MKEFKKIEGIKTAHRRENGKLITTDLFRCPICKSEIKMEQTEVIE